MIVACGFDHAGYVLRDRLLAEIGELGHEVLDFGTDRPDPIDYPDKALEVGHAVASGRAERGVIVCGSGAGVSVAAGKIRGVRAATIHDHYTAHQGVEHDGVNVLCLGGRVIGVERWWRSSRRFSAPRSPIRSATSVAAPRSRRSSVRWAT